MTPTPRSDSLFLGLLAAGCLALLSPAVQAAPDPGKSPHTVKSAVKSAAKNTSKTKRKTQTSSSPQTPASYAQRADAMALADEIASRRQLDPTWVRRTVGQAVQLPQVVQLMTPAPASTPKNWDAYRARFIEPRRIHAGVAFWQAHRAALQRAEQTSGVPAALVVGIIGVETLYGKHTGNFRVLDALATLALDFPMAHPRATERQKFFRGELEHLLLMKREGIDPTQLRGSYAGAMGLPQFMPSSRANFAVDFDGDGRINLLGSAEDAIGSVANFLKAHGWQPGMPTHYAVQFDPERLDMDTLLAPDILPTFSAQSLMARGAIPDAAGQQHSGPLALVELQNGGAPPSYVVGTENFYAVTRYNWSSYYAMAVIELGQAVQHAMNASAASAAAGHMPVTPPAMPSR